MGFSNGTIEMFTADMLHSLLHRAATFRGSKSLQPVNNIKIYSEVLIISLKRSPPRFLTHVKTASITKVAESRKDVRFSFRKSRTN